MHRLQRAAGGEPSPPLLPTTLRTIRVSREHQAPSAHKEPWHSSINSCLLFGAVGSSFLGDYRGAEGTAAAAKEESD